MPGRPTRPGVGVYHSAETALWIIGTGSATTRLDLAPPRRGLLKSGRLGEGTLGSASSEGGLEGSEVGGRATLTDKCDSVLGGAWSGTGFGVVSPGRPVERSRTHMRMI